MIVFEFVNVNLCFAFCLIFFRRARSRSVISFQLRTVIHGVTFILMFSLFITKSLRDHNEIFVERPKSAMLQAIEDKVFSISFPGEKDDDDDDDDDDEEEVAGDGGVEDDIIAHQDEDINIHDDMVSFLAVTCFTSVYCLAKTI